MKDDDEIKRLRNLLVGAFLLLLILMTIIVAYLTWNIGDIRRDNLYLQERIDLIEKSQPKDGLDGKDGKDGISIVGPQGEPGEDSVSTETIILEKEPIIIEQKGEKGDQGEPGAPGRSIFSRLNELTNEFECRVAGDREWKPEAECM